MPGVDPVTASPDLPQQVDVAVIGGGVIGITAAWHLARDGYSVAVFEKGRIAGEQSSRNWGYCRQQGRDPSELPLIVESLRQWRTLSREVGADTGFRERGIIYVTDRERDVAAWQTWLEHARPFQIRTELLDGDGVARLFPRSAKRWHAGLWTASDGRAEPAHAVPAIARDLKARGGCVCAPCAVRGLDIAGGRAVGVVTERGRIAADAVLLAGGAWSRHFCKRHGIRLKQLNVKASVLRTAPAPDVVTGGFAAPDFSIRRREDGGYSLARGGATTYAVVPDGLRWFTDFWPSYWEEKHRMKVRIDRTFFDELFADTRWSLDAPTVFEKHRTLEPQADTAVLGQAFRAMKAAFPELAPVTAAEQWAGMIDATPDAVPVISGVDALPGFFIATGFSGHGFGIGPGAGRLAAELTTNRPTCVDPAPFSLARQ
ncbi:MAG: FAD-binding oxidoreductase [Pseudomonadota bacterium]